MNKLKLFLRNQKNRKILRSIFQFLFVSAILISCVISNAKTLRVAVIDTGINPYLEHKLKLCGMKDFTENGMYDEHGHGSHILATIAEYAQDSDYCLVVLKFFDKNASGSKNQRMSNEAFEYALSQNIDILNYSGGGPNRDSREEFLIKKLLNQGVVINVAAGNESKFIGDGNSCFYPACYDHRINVIGALSSFDILKRLSTSNTGPAVNFFRIGELSVEIGPNIYKNMTGTSQATAVYTGEMIREKSK